MLPHYKDEKILIYKIKCAPFDNNAYLIVCRKTRESIIIDTPAEYEELVRVSEETNVKAILITHGHSDHIEGLYKVTSCVSSPVYVGESDASMLPKDPDHLLKDGDIISAGEVSVKTLATPGHTPGSTCFLVYQHLFTGDTLFPGGPGRSVSPATLLQTIESIREKLFCLGDNLIFHPGHGEDGDIKTSKSEYKVYEGNQHDIGLYGNVLWLKD